MKKLFFILTSVCFMAACSNSSTSGNGADSSATSTTDTTSTMSSPAPADTSTAASSTAMKDGVMTLKDGKLMVMKNGSWQAATEDVTCTNGVKVTTRGEMTKGGKSKTLTEGMMIDKDGQLTDAGGKLVDNAGW